MWVFRLIYNAIWAVCVGSVVLAIYLALESTINATKHPHLMGSLVWAGLLFLLIDAARASDRISR
jgi:hypothetical protein